MKSRKINISRKVLYIFLSVLLVVICSLTIAYAALSVTLNIGGQADVVGSNWDIHFANPVVESGSVSNNLPTVTAQNVSFSTNLSMPGDYYEFTVDIVNGGSIAAMIESINKTKDLTDEQKKYLNYTIEYADGSPIGLRQTINGGESFTIKVLLEFRKDISSSELPSSSSTIDLSLNVVFSQTNFYKLPDELGNINSGVHTDTVIKAAGKSFNAVPGMTLYDAINQKKSDMMEQGSSDYPSASEYEIDDSDGSYVFINEETYRVYNLKNTIIEAGKTYTSTSYVKTYNVSDDDMLSENYNTTLIDVASIFRSNGFDVSGSAYYPVFVNPNDTYQDVTHSLFLGGYYFADPSVIREFEQYVLEDYAVGFPSGQDAGCGTTSVHVFYAYLDSNGNLINISSKINHFDMSQVYYIMIDEEEMTFEEACLYVQEMANSYLS